MRAVRQTSVDTYNEIKEKGLVGRLQFEVYDAIYKHGPITQGELMKIAFEARENTAMTIRPRFAELERLGTIEIVDKRPCKVTGRECLVWDVTGTLPEKSKEDHKAEQFNAERAFRDLQDKVNRLEVEVSTLKYATPRGDQSRQMSLF